jgi:hypothetical protein
MEIPGDYLGWMDIQPAEEAVSVKFARTTVVFFQTL